VLLLVAVLVTVLVEAAPALTRFLNSFRVSLYCVRGSASLASRISAAPCETEARRVTCVICVAVSMHNAGHRESPAVCATLVKSRKTSLIDDRMIKHHGELALYPYRQSILKTIGAETSGSAGCTNGTAHTSLVSTACASASASIQA
jgi:hypothetical protein